MKPESKPEVATEHFKADVGGADVEEHSNISLLNTAVLEHGEEVTTFIDGSRVGGLTAAATRSQIWYVGNNAIWLGVEMLRYGIARLRSRLPTTEG